MMRTGASPPTIRPAKVAVGFTSPAKPHARTQSTPPQPRNPLRTATFVVAKPALRPHAGGTPMSMRDIDDEPTVRAPLPHRYRILVVDDESDFRHLISMFLQRSGMPVDVETAEN